MVWVDDIEEGKLSRWEEEGMRGQTLSFTSREFPAEIKTPGVVPIGPKTLSPNSM